MMDEKHLLLSAENLSWQKACLSESDFAGETGSAPWRLKLEALTLGVFLELDLKHRDD